MQRLHSFEVKWMRFKQNPAPLILAQKGIKRVRHLAIIRANLNAVYFSIIHFVQSIKWSVQNEMFGLSVHSTWPLKARILAFLYTFTIVVKALVKPSVGLAYMHLNGPNSISAPSYHVTGYHCANTCGRTGHNDITSL